VKRSRIKPESAKHRAYREELARNTPLVRARAHNICECCRIRDGRMAHHRLRRTQGGGNDLFNLLWVCPPCHDWIHDHPEESYEKGYMVRKGGQREDEGYTI
jgi:hypothetical protein